jgi:predicted GNAT family N-acyltransferase
MIRTSVTDMGPRMIDGISIRLSFGVEELHGVLALRYDILRKPHGLPFESASFPNDENPTTCHFLAFQNHELVGCVSVLWNSSEDSAQLRGMAVSGGHQRNGIGRCLLQAAHQAAIEKRKSLWCNARFSAIGFYEKHGWIPDGPFFDVPVIGQHVVMKKVFVT